MMISPADSSLTTSAPDKSDDLLQSSVTSLIVSQTPTSSAMVKDWIVAREDKAPSNPVTVTTRPASDRLSSRNAVR